MNIKNMTPHTVTLIGEGGSSEHIHPTGICPRCAQESVKIGEVTVNGVTVPIVKTVFGEVSDLPDREEDTIFIVSLPVAKTAARDDLVIPTDLVRDDGGVIIGCRALGRV